MGIPHCGVCGKLPTLCENDPLCPRGVLRKQKWHTITTEGKDFSEIYIKMPDAINAMKEYAKNYGLNELTFTREVLIEKNQNK
jgi:antitoxin component HigA of HigAB toxin-antitoxin module